MLWWAGVDKTLCGHERKEWVSLSWQRRVGKDFTGEVIFAELGKKNKQLLELL